MCLIIIKFCFKITISQGKCPTRSTKYKHKMFTDHVKGFKQLGYYTTHEEDIRTTEKI
jgi:hypothetical protein